MNHRIILKISAVLGLMYAVVFIISPNTIPALYNAEPMNNPGMYNSALFGAALLGFAVMNWAASEAPEIAEIHYVLIGNLTFNAAGLMVATYRQITIPTTTQMGWLNVALFLVFTGLFAYLYMASPAGYRLHAHTRHA